MKRLLLLPALLLVLNAFAQKKIKYETVFFEDRTVESPSARFMITGALCEDELIKAKIKVTNYTDKTLVIKPEEIFYTTPKGNSFSHDRWLVIAPRQQESKVIDAKGDGIKTDSASLNINGIYLCNEAEITKAEPMNIPPAKELKIGNFKLEQDFFDQDGKEVVFRYKIQYVGDKIGAFTPSKVTLKSASGTEFKNQKEKDRTLSFKKNEDFIVAFVYLSDSKKDNVINWNDAFTESTPEKAENVQIKLVMDATKTKEKND